MPITCLIVLTSGSLSRLTWCIFEPIFRAHDAVIHVFAYIVMKLYPRVHKFVIILKSFISRHILFESFNGNIVVLEDDFMEDLVQYLLLQGEDRQA